MWTKEGVYNHIRLQLAEKEKKKKREVQNRIRNSTMFLRKEEIMVYAKGLRMEEIRQTMPRKMVVVREILHVEKVETQKRMRLNEHF